MIGTYFVAQSHMKFKFWSIKCRINDGNLHSEIKSFSGHNHLCLRASGYVIRLNWFICRNFVNSSVKVKVSLMYFAFIMSNETDSLNKWRKTSSQAFQFALRECLLLTDGANISSLKTVDRYWRDNAWLHLAPRASLCVYRKLRGAGEESKVLRFS